MVESFSRIIQYLYMEGSDTFFLGFPYRTYRRRCPSFDSLARTLWGDGRIVVGASELGLSSD
jgi:hypothetical protein